MAAAIQPEIRFRLDPQERDQLEQIGARIGMSPNEMVKVFVKRAIVEGGLPFEMRAVAHDNRSGERFMPIFGQSPALLAEVASNAARDAALRHIRAGRLPERRDQTAHVEEVSDRIR
jgi:antitoxin component of RelBE/YafQ-DinJ toxin-antitoxin module